MPQEERGRYDASGSHIKAQDQQKFAFTSKFPNYSASGPGLACCDVYSLDGQVLARDVLGVITCDGKRMLAWKDGVYSLMDMTGNVVWSHSGYSW